MPNFMITLAGASDIESVASMFDRYRQFYEQKADLKRATDFISSRINNRESIIFIAQDSKGAGIGFCQLYPTFCSVEAIPIYVLYDLFVSPECRRGGVASELLFNSAEHARSNNIGRLDLSTAKNNLSAQTLYESLGWIRDEVFYTYSFHPNN